MTGLVVFNSLCWPRTEIIEIPLAEGLPNMKQYSAFGRTGYALGKQSSNYIFARVDIRY
jgi:hypothetical protein